MLKQNYEMNRLEFDRRKVINIWYLNIGCEIIWGNIHEKGRWNNNHINASEQLCALLSNPNDLLILQNDIPNIVEENFHELGLPLCKRYILQNNISYYISENILNDHYLIETLKDMNMQGYLMQLIPFGVTCYDILISNITKIRIWGADISLSTKFNNKINVLNLCGQLDIPCPLHEVFDKFERNKILEFYSRCTSHNAVMKTEYGASGKALYKVNSEKDIDLFKKYLDKLGLKENFYCEEWLTDATSFNHQIIIDNGLIKRLPISFQIVDNGIYRGSRFTDTSKELNYLCESIEKKVYQHINNKNGVISMDGIFDRENIYPIIDLNLRFSLSTYLFGINRRKNRKKNRVFSVIYITCKLDILQVKERLNNFKYNQKEDKGAGVIMFSKNAYGEFKRIYFYFIEEDESKLAELEKNFLCTLQLKK